jgi:hypothetical protein
MSNPLLPVDHVVNNWSITRIDRVVNKGAADCLRKKYRKAKIILIALSDRGWAALRGQKRNGTVMIEV